MCRSFSFRVSWVWGLGGWRVVIAVIKKRKKAKLGKKYIPKNKQKTHTELYRVSKDELNQALALRELHNRGRNQGLDTWWSEGEQSEETRRSGTHCATDRDAMSMYKVQSQEAARGPGQQDSPRGQLWTVVSKEEPRAWRTDHTAG